MWRTRIRFEVLCGSKCWTTIPRPYRGEIQDLERYKSFPNWGVSLTARRLPPDRIQRQTSRRQRWWRFNHRLQKHGNSHAHILTMLIAFTAVVVNLLGLLSSRRHFAELPPTEESAHVNQFYFWHTYRPLLPNIRQFSTFSLCTDTWKYCSNFLRIILLLNDKLWSYTNF